jgi:hypothetical protein
LSSGDSLPSFLPKLRDSSQTKRSSGDTKSCPLFTYDECIVDGMISHELGGSG